MELLFENQFVAIYQDSSAHIIKAIWSKKTESMQDEEFQTCIKAIWENIKRHKPNGFIGDTRDFSFAIHPNLQAWYGQNIGDTFGKGTNKIAMVMSKHFIEQLSIEQTIDEDKTKGVITQYFGDEDEAMEWASVK